MIGTKRIYNFSAGPSTLPTPVLESIQKDLLSYQGTGMSIIEMSHRGAIFEDIYQQSIQSFREIASIPDRFDILYMTGGASAQFALIPMHFAIKRKPAYVNTGIWSQKAIAQAEIQHDNVYIAGSSEEQNFQCIPSTIDLESDYDYLHITSNNTIYGTQYKEIPKARSAKTIVDMSSDFLSKPISWDSIGIAYAGTQKNAGPSGLTIVIIDQEYYQYEKESTPSMFCYSTFAKSKSMYNTPPTFQIYVFGLILEWIRSLGGLEEVSKLNRRKAEMIYKVIDASSGFYRPHADIESRSLMNITWNTSSDALNKTFLEGADEREMSGLKGHRSVGGIRASIYNAMSEQGCESLAEYMQDFAQKHLS